MTGLQRQTPLEAVHCRRGCLALLAPEWALEEIGRDSLATLGFGSSRDGYKGTPQLRRSSTGFGSRENQTKNMPGRCKGGTPCGLGSTSASSGPPLLNPYRQDRTRGHTAKLMRASSLSAKTASRIWSATTWTSENGSLRSRIGRKRILRIRSHTSKSPSFSRPWRRCKLAKDQQKCGRTSLCN